MSWTDRKSIEHIKQIRDEFDVKTLVETGTFKGLNIITHLNNFKELFSCEVNQEYYDYAVNKIMLEWEKSHYHVGRPFIYKDTSQNFLKWFTKELYPFEKKNEYVIFYLDAHFYDVKNRDKENIDRFVVLQELKELKGFKKAIIIIHDFDNNLGHITYDGVSLDLELLKKDLLKVNPKFKFYTNELASCDIMKPYETDDKDMKENLEYAWSKPEKTYRGILYCLPKEVNIKGLREICQKKR